MSVLEARELAVRVHADQRDRDDSFHINHVARVAESVRLEDAHQRVAWLHDVIEDGDLTDRDLEARLEAAELDALRLLTHDDPSEPYDRYLRRIIEAPGRAGDLARAIKEADMLDNLRRCVRDRDSAVAQYGRGLAALWAVRSG